jgi:hypothetical protein
LVRMWDVLREDPTVELTPDVFKRMKQVAHGARLDSYRDLTIKVKAVAWNVALKIAAMVQRAIGSAA